MDSNLFSIKMHLLLLIEFSLDFFNNHIFELFISLAFIRLLHSNLPSHSRVGIY